MSDIMEYKCPACGGAMEFDSKSQKMKCPYCDTVMSVEEFEKNHPEKQSADTSSDLNDAQFQAVSDGQWQEGETNGMRIYACASCGGEIVADESTGATSCPFCGNRIVMKGQFSGDLKPDYIIPFKFDKKGAKQAYKRHLSGKKLMPKVFRQENHIDEIKGVYVPFWLFDGEADADITYNAERRRVWESGDTEYTEHEYYEVKRAGRVGFQHIPADGSSKMDDVLMESIEPYDFSGAVPFQSAYLAGYVADRYDVSKEERMTRARERIKKSTEDAFAATVQGYHSVSPTSTSIQISNARYLYALYPVWLLNTTWKGQKYVFAMNGQTGKMVGDLPVDEKAFWKYVGTRAVIFGAIIYGLTWFFTLL